MILGSKRTELDHHLIDLSNHGLVLGYTTIRTTDILNNFQMKKQGTFQLEGYSEEAFIRLLLTIRLTEFSQNIYTNQSLPRIPFPNLENYDKNQKKELPIGQAPKLNKTNQLRNIEKDADHSGSSKTTKKRKSK